MFERNVAIRFMLYKQSNMYNNISRVDDDEDQKTSKSVLTYVVRNIPELNTTDVEIIETILCACIFIFCLENGQRK
jgi:hypothetical protein